MIFSTIVEKGIKKIYDEDLETQKHFLSVLMKEVRGIDEYENLLDFKCFFVPNESYMLEYFGEEIRDPLLDVYDFNGNCVWNNYIVFPIRNVGKRVVGFVGFDAITKAKKQSGEQSVDSHYRYSSSTIFRRGKYLFGKEGVYDKCVSDGYVILTDGVFDMVSLDREGINTMSMLGSKVSDNILFQLRFIDNVFLAEDNDRAGRDLYYNLKKHLPNLRYVRQNKFGDVDDILKSEYKNEFLEGLRNSIHDNVDYTLRIKP